MSSGAFTTLDISLHSAFQVDRWRIPMQAFMSYQTADRAAAARAAELLGGLGISPFMAHENIEVSKEWRDELLVQIEKSELFVPILSANYFKSVWCVQEFGIAASRKKTVIPLSIDGSIPQGFLSPFQSKTFNPLQPALATLLPGLIHHYPAFTLDALIEKIGSSGNYRNAEANFAIIHPYLAQATGDQIVKLLKHSTYNSQIYDAGGCNSGYLPELVAQHGHLMDPKDLAILKTKLAKYGH